MPMGKGYGKKAKKKGSKSKPAVPMAAYKYGKGKAIKKGKKK